MSKIITVDLSEGQIGESEYTFGPGRDYGRGLAMRLLKEHVPDSCGRLDAENAVIYTPGLFTGNMAPSATRGLIMSKGEGKKGLCVSSITGDFPQKLASLDIASIVVTGKYEKRNAVIFVDPNGAELMCMPELEDHTTAEMVDMLRKQFGEDWRHHRNRPGCGPYDAAGQYFRDLSRGTAKILLSPERSRRYPGKQGPACRCFKGTDIFWKPLCEQRGVS